MYRFLTFVFLFVIWIVLSGKFDPFHLALGVISSAFVTVISSDLYFSDRTIKIFARAQQMVRFAGYLIWLIYQIALANLHILRLALSPKGLAEVEPRVVRFKSILKSEFARYVLANSITLTPGTVTIKVEDNEFWVHVISRTSSRSLEGEMESRIAGVFDR